MTDFPIAPASVWLVLSPSGGIVHAQPHEPHPADARMWASHGATIVEYVPKEDARRCDGCHRYADDARAYPADGRCVTRGCATMRHDCCSRWEAKS